MVNKVVLYALRNTFIIKRKLNNVTYKELTISISCATARIITSSFY